MFDPFGFGVKQGNGKGKKKVTRVENIIDQAYLWELKQFYNQDDCIQKCRKRKQDSLLKHKASISWWFRDQEELISIPIMNEEKYQRALHDLLWCANDYLLLFGFVGFYVRKDIGKWVREKEKNGGILPFGVIQFGERQDQIPGHFIKRAIKSTIFGSEIVFSCTDESKKSKYTFFVIEKNATFRLSPPSKDKRNNYLHDDEGTSANLLPNSSFETLYSRWRRIIETTISIDDAHAQSCRPEPFLMSKPIPEQDVDKLSESARYLSDYLDQTGTEVAVDHLEQSYGYATDHCDRLKLQNRRYNTRSGGGGVNVTDERKSVFPRPSLTDNLEVLPPLVTLDRGHAPKPLINIDQLEEQYESGVCSVMCYPYLLFKAHSHSHTHTSASSGRSSSGGIHNTSQLDSANEALDDSIKGQEALFQEIFSELYMRSYAFLDLETLSHIPQASDPHFTPFLDGVCVRLVYNHQSPKTDLDMQNLSTLYTMGIISIKEFRSQIGRYGFDENGPIPKKPPNPNQPESVKKEEKKKRKEKKKESSEEEEEKKRAKKRQKTKEDEDEKKEKEKKEREK